MAWIERRTARYRVRFRLADGTVGTDSWHPTKAAAELRCKQVDVEQALDTYIDPAAGRITLAEWVAIWEPAHIAGPAKWAPTAATYASTSCPASATPRSTRSPARR
jgi:hypothetical protein